MSQLKLCKKCNQSNEPICHGYIGWLKDDCYECPMCQNQLEDTCITKEEYKVIDKISDDIFFLEAMIKLKQDDIIEYESKMSQFRCQLNQQKAVEEQKQESNVPKCPTCSSTDIKKISTTSKVMNTAMWGIFGTKRHKTYHCNSCGYEW